MGEPARALEVLEAVIRFDPFPPSPTFHFIGMANYMLKRYGDAVHWCRECLSRQPSQHFTYATATLAAAYAQSGQLEEAGAEAAELLRINPAFTIESWKRLGVFKNPKDADHLIEGMRKTGLPET